MREIWKEIMDKDWGTYEYLHEVVDTYYETLCVRLRYVERCRSDFFVGPLHGADHAERVMILGTILTVLECGRSSLIPWIIDACAWHDIMRIGNMTDAQHGEHAADIVEKYIVARDDDLRAVQAAIAAHSRGDRRIPDMMTKYRVQDRIGCEFMATVLKDADALDRVRSDDLDEKYLRFDTSKKLVGFAKWLYEEWR